MGVPRFYRWLSERYPAINQVLTDATQLPEIDNFYLDMNGIIHSCTHPNDEDLSQQLSEKEMFLGMFRYIERLVNIVKPQRLLFLAVDGVAPRAKLNQQRARRFRAAQERQERAEEARASGDATVDPDAVFDSNCITPGTEFMEKVNRHFQYLIQKKIKEDPMWRRLQIVYSGHDVPGEGEHKIMEYIRQMRAHPGHPPNLRHCMYGQDADLIMLGLCTHEPHFTLLREVIDFGAGRPRGGRSARQTIIKQTREASFQLLHLSVLREYLEAEFSYGLDAASYDVERLIDDFVFMTFLVGNDFLPHLPALDIAENAFDMIFDCYREIVRQHGRYLTCDGDIEDLALVEAFLLRVGRDEAEILQNREVEAAKFRTRQRRWNRGAGPSEEEVEEVEINTQQEYETAVLEKEGEAALLAVQAAARAGQKEFKGRYYFEKLRLMKNDADGHRQLRKSYLEGLAWCLAYYMKGCISWTWFYPYHYGPMLSDMRDLEELAQTVTFELGMPFDPFNQLLGCLPPLSHKLLPRPYQFLMISDESPIKTDFYPEDFAIDMNGKRNPWEAVILLPFIDAPRLLAAVAQYCPRSALSMDEASRNRCGTIHVYEFDATAMGTVRSCNPEIGLPDILHCLSTKQSFEPDFAPGTPFGARLVEGCSVPSPGFPSLASLPLQSVDVQRIKLNIFGSESRYRTMVMRLADLSAAATSDDDAANSLFTDLGQWAPFLGCSVWVNWPMIHEARLVAVSSSTEEVRLLPPDEQARKARARAGRGLDALCEGLGVGRNPRPQDDAPNGDGDGGGDGTEAESGNAHLIERTPHTPEDATAWRAYAEAEQTRYLRGRGTPGSGGVDVGEIKIRLRVQPLQGMRRDPHTGARYKVWGVQEADVPFQLAVFEPLVVDPRFVETAAANVSEMYPNNCSVVSVQGPYKGLTGTVVREEDDDKEDGDGDVEDPEQRKQQRRQPRPPQQQPSSAASIAEDQNPVVRVRFPVVPPEPPFGYAIALKIQDRYFPSRDVAKQLSLDPGLLGRITGSLFCDPGGYDLGLNLKVRSKFQLLGYVRRVAGRGAGATNGDTGAGAAATANGVWGAGDTVRVVGTVNEGEGDDETSDGGYWEYSARAIQLIAEYMARFPSLFHRLRAMSQNNANHKAFQLRDLFGRKGVETAEEIMSWMRTQTFNSLPRVPITTKSMSRDAILAVERAADVRESMLRKQMRDAAAAAADSVAASATGTGPGAVGVGPGLTQIVEVDPVSLFRPDLFTPVDAPLINSTPPSLGDRVVNLTATGVPPGLRGTVTAIHFHSGYVEVVFDSEFIAGSTLQGACSPFRGRLVSWSSVLKVSGPDTAPDMRMDTSADAQPQAQTKAQTQVRAQGAVQLDGAAAAAQQPKRGKNAARKEQAKKHREEQSGAIAAAAQAGQAAARQTPAAAPTAAATTTPASALSAAEGTAVLRNLLQPQTVPSSNATAKPVDEPAAGPDADQTFGPDNPPPPPTETRPPPPVGEPPQQQPPLPPSGPTPFPQAPMGPGMPMPPQQMAPGMWPYSPVVAHAGPAHPQLLQLQHQMMAAAWRPGVHPHGAPPPQGQPVYGGMAPMPPVPGPPAPMVKPGRSVEEGDAPADGKTDESAGAAGGGASGLNLSQPVYRFKSSKRAAAAARPSARRHKPSTAAMMAAAASAGGTKASNSKKAAAASAAANADADVAASAADGAPDQTTPTQGQGQSGPSL